MLQSLRTHVNFCSCWTPWNCELSSCSSCYKPTLVRSESSQLATHLNVHAPDSGEVYINASSHASHACMVYEWCAGEGACTEIPQLEDTPASTRTRAAPAACATAFPTAVKGGLLFVWMVPGADGLLQSAGCATPKIPRVCSMHPPKIQHENVAFFSGWRCQ